MSSTSSDSSSEKSQNSAVISHSVTMTLSSTTPQQEQQWEKLPRKSLAQPTIKKNTSTPVPRIEILLERGENLPIRKSSKATSSPYAVISLCHDAFLSQKRLESSSVKNTLDPTWFEVFEFNVSPSVKEKGKIEEIVTVQVWHKGVFNKGVDSFM